MMLSDQCANLIRKPEFDEIFDIVSDVTSHFVFRKSFIETTAKIYKKIEIMQLL